MVSPRPAGFVAVLAFGVLAAPAPAQTTTGSTFKFTIRHEQEGEATTRAGEGVVGADKARLRFGEVSGDSRRWPIDRNTTVLVTGAGDPVESLVLANDSVRLLMRPARMIADIRQMMATMPQAPRITASLVSMQADTTEPETRAAGLPARRYRSSGEILVVFSTLPSPDVVTQPDTARLTLATDVLHSWAAPGMVDPFRGIQSLDLLLDVAGGDPAVAREIAKILAALPTGLPLRSEWTVTVARHGGSSTGRAVVELSNVGNAAVAEQDLAVPPYPEVGPGNSQ